MTATSAPSKRTRACKSKRPALKLGTCNFHTMTTGLDDLKNISDARKTAVINDEHLRLKIDISTLQETRLADSGSLKEKDYTFYWQGKSAEHRREHGVGFAVRNTLLKTVEPGDKGCERLLTLRVYTSDGPISIISAYAPTLASTPEAEDEFYPTLNVVIKNIPNNEQLVLLGEFNARVGADLGSWPSFLGSFGVGKVNDNGQRLLEVCSYHGLCVTNTFFQTKPQRRVCFIPAPVTAQTVTQTTLLYAARSA